MGLQYVANIGWHSMDGYGERVAEIYGMVIRDSGMILKLTEDQLNSNWETNIRILRED